MTMNSSDVNTGDDILASEYNDLRQDVRESNCDTTTRYLCIGGGAFKPRQTSEGANYDLTNGRIAVSAVNNVMMYAGVNLPHGAIVTSFKVYWYRDVELAVGTCYLSLNSLTSSGYNNMAEANSNSFAGYHSVEDTTISSATIDNTAYIYFIELLLSPNTDADSVYCLGVVITYTIAKSLP